MTNEQMIVSAAIQSGIISETAATAYIKSGRRLPIHTYSEWKRMGYQVKPGEHAALVLYLWKFRKPSKKEQEEGEDPTRETAYRAKSHLFTLEQVEKAESRAIKTREEIAAYNAMLAEQRKARASA